MNTVLIIWADHLTLLASLLLASQLQQITRLAVKSPTYLLQRFKVDAARRAPSSAATALCCTHRLTANYCLHMT